MAAVQIPGGLDRGSRSNFPGSTVKRDDQEHPNALELAAVLARAIALAHSWEPADREHGCAEPSGGCKNPSRAARSSAALLWPFDDKRIIIITSGLVEEGSRRCRRSV